MSDYYMIKVHLTPTQLEDFQEALQHFQPLTVTFKYAQLDDEFGELILVTEAQFKRIMKALELKKGIRLTFSQDQLRQMHSGIMYGHGFLDSIGNFFKNSFNSAKNFVTSKLPKRGTVTVKPGAKPAFKDYGPEYDHMPPGYKPPKKTGLDYVAHKIGKFDNMINNTFGYNTTRLPQEWKEQKLGYTPGNFRNPDNDF